MITAYLYPEFFTRELHDGGWALDNVPSTFDVIVFHSRHLQSMAQFAAEFHGTVALTVPVWVERGSGGVQVTAAITPQIGTVSPYELSSRMTDGGFYIDCGAARFLRPGDEVQVSYWSSAGQSRTYTTAVSLMSGPEEGFPLVLWENPAVFQTLISGGPSGPMTAYFPPLSTTQQRDITRALHRRTVRASKDAGWVRWAPSPFVVLEALVPEGLETVLESSGWSVGTMARVAYDVPHAVWIGRDFLHTPFTGPSDLWIRRHGVPAPESTTWTLPLGFSFGLDALQPLSITQSTLSHSLDWCRRWPGIVIQSPPTYEAFQRWTTDTLQGHRAKPRAFPIRWGQPDPAPVIAGLLATQRLVVAFHQWHEVDELSLLAADTEQRIQNQNGHILSIRGWARGCAQ